MNNRKHNKQGFTLIEVLISVAVLSIVLLAAISSLVTIIRTNATNENTIIAYGLAQEGVEAIRNIRDSDWLLGSDFSQKGSVGGSLNLNLVWKYALPDKNETSFYTVDYNNSFVKPVGDGSVNPSDAPWVLKKLECSSEEDCAKDNSSVLYSMIKKIGESQSTLLMPSSKNLTNYAELASAAKHKFELMNGKSINNYYSHNSSTDKQKSMFHRFIKITEIPHKIGTSPEALEGIKKYRIESCVYWLDDTLLRKVVLTTELTDWKQL